MMARLNMSWSEPSRRMANPSVCLGMGAFRNFLRGNTAIICIRRAGLFLNNLEPRTLNIEHRTWNIEPGPRPTYIAEFGPSKFDVRSSMFNVLAFLNIGALPSANVRFVVETGGLTPLSGNSVSQTAETPSWELARPLTNRPSDSPVEN